MPRPRDLRGEDPGDVGDVAGQQGALPDHPGGVHHGRDPFPPRAEPGHQGGDRLAVGDVARGDGDPRAEGGQFLGQLRGAGGVRAPPGQQHEVFDASLGERSGDMGAERANAPGDQRCSPGPPRVRAPGFGRGADQATHPRSGGAHGQLVLALPDQVGQARGGALVGPAGEVDEATPQLGVFQGQRHPQAPAQCLCWSHGVARVDRRRPGGHHPHRRAVAASGEGAHQRHGRGQAGGDDGVDVVRLLVEGEQRDDPGDRCGQVAVEVAGGDGHRVRAPGGQRLLERGQQPRVHSGGWDDDQPGAGESGGVLGERTPRHSVPPVVGPQQVASPAAPGGERRERGPEWLVLVEPWDVGQVGPLEGVPERRVLRRLGRLPVDGRTARLRPVQLGFERVGRQFDTGPARSGVVRGPVDGRAPHPQFRQGRHEGFRFSSFPARHRDEGGPLVRDAVAGECGERAVRAESQEHLGAAGLQGGDGVGEPHRPPDLPHPVLGVGEFVRVGELAGHGGDDRDGRW